MLFRMRQRIVRTSDAICESSVDSAFKNFFRAGVLKKRSRTVMRCLRAIRLFDPRHLPAVDLDHCARRGPPDISARRFPAQPRHDAIEGSASPRNPSVATPSKSSAFLIFDVACARTPAWHRRAPCRIRVGNLDHFFPPASTLILIRVAPASSAFSNKLLHYRGSLSTTCPRRSGWATCSKVS